MKNIIIAGASGMVGGIVQRACLQSDSVKNITSIVRKPSGIQHAKLTKIVHKDFSNYASIATAFKDKDAAFFCIGAYTGQVKDELFKKITVDFSNAFGDAVKENSPHAKFCLLSGAGADQKEKSRISFAKYKGMAENHLIKLNFEHLYIFRPGYIYPVEKRTEPNLSYRIFRSLYPLMKTIYSSGVITSEQLAQAMFKAGMNGTEKMILENQDIKAV